VVTRHFSFATRKTENSLKIEPEGKARDGQLQKLIVSELSDWPENLNLMSRNELGIRYEKSPWKTGGHFRNSLMNILPVALT